MRKWVLGAVLCAGIAAGAIVVASSSAGGGGAGGGQTRHYTGVFYVNNNSTARIGVVNLSGSKQDVTVSFKGIGGDSSSTSEIPKNGYDADFVSGLCTSGPCIGRAEVRSKSPLIAPTLRYLDSNATLQEVFPGDFVVVRDGKRIP